MAIDLVYRDTFPKTMNLEGKKAELAAHYVDGHFTEGLVGSTGSPMYETRSPEIRNAYALTFTYTYDQLSKFQTDLAALKSDSSIAKIESMNPADALGGPNINQMYELIHGDLSDIEKGRVFTEMLEGDIKNAIGHIKIFFGYDHPEYSITIPA